MSEPATDQTRTIFLAFDSSIANVNDGLMQPADTGPYKERS